MANPYEPPQGTEDNRLDRLMVPGKYAGGFWAVAAVGVGGGILIALIIFSEIWVNIIPTPFIAPAVVWIGALAVLMTMLRDSEIHPISRLIVPVAMAVPAYILYVPVCTFSAMMTTTFLGSQNYGPSFAGLVLASILAFLGVLLIFAAILRQRFKQPVMESDTVISVGNSTDFTAPINEAGDE